MVRYRRNILAGGTYFFTVTLRDRRSRALVQNVDELRAAFRLPRRERPFGIDAIVVLPDHLHAILSLPEDDGDFPGRWRRIKSLFTRAVAPRVGLQPDRRGEYPLWQRHYWEHTIRDEADWVRHLGYIHSNPVKHRLVEVVEDWPYSSFHRYMRQGLLPSDWKADLTDEPGDFGEPNS